MTEVLNKFKQYYTTKEPGDIMYIVGPGGSGKTYSLTSIINHLLSLDKVPNIFVCAYTHKAVGVLAESLGILAKKVKLSTVHSLINLRPTINAEALELSHIDNSIQGGSAALEDDKKTVILVDEFSMLNEKDNSLLLDWIEEDESTIEFKNSLVLLGDPYQLPPVKGEALFYPEGEFAVHLTSIKRSANAPDIKNKVLEIYNLLATGKGNITWEQSENITLVNSSDELALKYSESTTDNKVLLVYTNKVAHDYNVKISNKEVFEVGDIIKAGPTIGDILVSKKQRLDDIPGDSFRALYLKSTQNSLVSNNHFKSLSAILDLPEELQSLFYLVNDTYLVLNNTYLYNQWLQTLKYNLVTDNKKKISNKKSWNLLLSFQRVVHSVELCYAMTVHKAQGSTYSEVYVDITNIRLCRQPIIGLKLLYVAVSRASKKLILKI